MIYRTKYYILQSIYEAFIFSIVKNNRICQTVHGYITRQLLNSNRIALTGEKLT